MYTGSAFMKDIEVLKVFKNHFSGEKHLYKYNMPSDEGILIFIAGGSGKCVLGKKRYTFSKNTILFCLGDLLCFKCSKSIDADIFAVHFKVADSGSFNEEYGIKSDVFKIYDSDAFCDSFERLYIANIHSRHSQKGLLSAIFCQLLFLISDSRNEKPLTDAVIASLAEDIHKDFIHGEFDVSSYADKVGLSKDRLSVIFKQKYSLPPYKYQLMLKMDEATNLLLHTNLPIGKISEILGFSNPLYFSSAYKKQTGKTPGGVRKEAEIK